jgi:uncharacterized protein (TIGR02301 family)
MRTWLILTAALALAFPALAQERPPPERATLGELAYALGESHGLRQLCRGLTDQYWRDRMLRLTQVEEADPGLDAVLRERFNTGYAAGQAAAPACGAVSRRAEAAAAARGQALAGKLSTVMRKIEPNIIGEPAPE